MELKNYIKVTDNVLPVTAIARLIQYLNKLKFEDASIIGTHEQRFKGEEPVNKDVRSAKVKALNRDVESLSEQHWFNVLGSTFAAVLGEYNKEHGNTCVDGMVDIQAIKYEIGDHYTVHSDHCLKFVRTMSIILFLNDDYKGGELYFTNPNNWDQEYFEVKPKAGRLVMFPSNFLFSHGVKKVKSSTRLVIVGWMK